MYQVTIHRCPVCDSIRSHTDEVVQQLTQDGIIPAVHDGKKREFRIEVDGKTIVDHTGQSLPEAEHCVNAVEQEIDSRVLAS